MAASMVEARKRRMASSTCASVATTERESFARDSAIRVMASSWRMVMGMEERAEVVDSWAWICRRRETKCEDRASAAEGERRGAQRLFCCWGLVCVCVFVGGGSGRGGD